MAEHCMRTMGQHRRHPPGLDRDRSVSDGIDTSMQAIETTMGDPGADHLLGQPDLPELPPPHHPVLTARESGDLSVENLRVEFWLLSNRKSTGVFHPAEDAERIRTRGARFVPFQSTRSALERKEAPARRYRL